MIEVAIYNSSQHEQLLHRTGRLRLGRGYPNQGQAYRIKDPDVAPTHLTLTPVDDVDAPSVLVQCDDTVELASSGEQLTAGAQQTVALPCQLRIGRTWIEVSDGSAPRNPHHHVTTFPNLDEGPDATAAFFESLGNAPSSQTLARWMDGLGRIQRSVAGSDQFFQDGAAAIHQPGGLEAGLVILKAGERLEILASALPRPELGITYDRQLVQQVFESGRPLFHTASPPPAVQEITKAHDAVVAPVFDENKEVIGVVYGMRHQHPNNSRRGIRPLEAQFVQLVSDAMTAGLVRLNREAEAARHRVLLQQAFPPAVIRQLETNPALLDGHRQEVTVLFCDLRGFSHTSERLGNQTAYQLLSDILARLSKCVAQHDGVIIDYYGDGLAAFWNAPVMQTDHASRACAAGLDMLAELPGLNEDWQDSLESPLELGIGVHTGDALVGNSGTQRKIKYGPRGATVNIASRVEAATKQIGVPILISSATRERIADQYLVRRVCRTRFPGVGQQIQLFQPYWDSLPDDQRWRLQQYERALLLYEQQQFAESHEVLRALQQDPRHHDRATDFLAHQAAARRDGKCDRRKDDVLEHFAALVSAESSA